MNKKIWIVIKFLFAALLIFSGVQHILNPSFFEPFYPSFVPYKSVLTYISGFVEIALGILLINPKTLKQGATWTMLLMIAFLPIHIWDMFQENPAIGSKIAAYIRIPVQFLLIWIAHRLSKI